jgi:hypothetical protein
MAYLVATAGRVHLPEHLEEQALTVLEVELTPHQGRFHPDEPVDDLTTLARYVGAEVSREGDWLVFSTDRAGEPMWSEQASAFYTGLGRFVTDGEVQLRGQDGAHWAYRYSPDGVTEHGTRGGTETEPAQVDPVPAPAPAPAPAEEPPPPPASESAWPPPVDRPTAPEQPPNPFFAEDAPPPRSPGRTVAMAVLLLGGIFLIVAIAMLAAGIG